MKEDTLIRIAALGFVALAIAAAALAGNTKIGGEGNLDSSLPSSVPVMPEPDLPVPNLQEFELPNPFTPLSDCLAKREAAVHDQDCLSAWEDNRQRFLGNRKDKTGNGETK